MHDLENYCNEAIPFLELETAEDTIQQISRLQQVSQNSWDTDYDERCLQSLWLEATTRYHEAELFIG